MATNKGTKVARITIGLTGTPGINLLTIFDFNRMERRFLVLTETLTELSKGLPSLFRESVRTITTYVASSRAEWPQRPQTDSQRWAEVEKVDGSSNGSIHIGLEPQGDRMSLTVTAPDGFAIQILETIDGLESFSQKLQAALQVARVPGSSQKH